MYRYAGAFCIYWSIICMHASFYCGWREPTAQSASCVSGPEISACNFAPTELLRHLMFEILPKSIALL